MIEQNKAKIFLFSKAWEMTHPIVFIAFNWTTKTIHSACDNIFRDFSSLYVIVHMS